MSARSPFLGEGAERESAWLWQQQVERPLGSVRSQALSLLVESLDSCTLLIQCSSSYFPNLAPRSPAAWPLCWGCVPSVSEAFCAFQLTRCYRLILAQVWPCSQGSTLSDSIASSSLQRSEPQNGLLPGDGVFFCSFMFQHKTPGSSLLCAQGLAPTAHREGPSPQGLTLASLLQPQIHTQWLQTCDSTL